MSVQVSGANGGPVVSMFDMKPDSLAYSSDEGYVYKTLTDIVVNFRGSSWGKHGTLPKDKYVAPLKKGDSITLEQL